MAHTRTYAHAHPHTRTHAHSLTLTLTHSICRYTPSSAITPDGLPEHIDAHIFDEAEHEIRLLLRMTILPKFRNTNAYMRWGIALLASDSDLDLLPAEVMYG